MGKTGRALIGKKKITKKSKNVTKPLGNIEINSLLVLRDSLLQQGASVDAKQNCHDKYILLKKIHYYIVL